MPSVKFPMKPLAKLRYKGIFDFEGLYKVMHSWCTEREYDFFERRFKHKVRPEGSELEIDWEAYREVTEFVKNWVFVYFHLWNYKEVEVVKDGKKKKLVQARMLIEIWPELELDYDERWSDTPFKRTLRDFYINYMIRHDIESIWEDKLWYNTNKLVQEVKRYLDMESVSEVFDDYW